MVWLLWRLQAVLQGAWVQVWEMNRAQKCLMTWAQRIGRPKPASFTAMQVSVCTWTPKVCKIIVVWVYSGALFEYSGCRGPPNPMSALNRPTIHNIDCSSKNPGVRRVSARAHPCYQTWRRPPCDPLGHGTQRCLKTLQYLQLPKPFFSEAPSNFLFRALKSELTR